MQTAGQIGVYTHIKKRVRIKSLLLACIGGALALTAAHFANDWWRIGRFLESTDDAYVGGEVTVMAPKVAGLIAEVLVADNQTVKAGDLLIKIDDRDYRAALAKSEGVVAASAARLANLESQRRLQVSVIAEAGAGISSAEAEVARTSIDVTRYRALAQSEFASTQRYQQADADNKKGLAGVTRARAAREAALRQIDVIESQRLEAKAALDQAAAERDLARLNIAYTEIRAPIDGIIGNRSARRGAYAAIGTQLVSIVPLHGLWVDANFKEDQLAHMRSGQSAVVIADALPDHPFHGHIASLAPATGAQFSVLPPENATGNFTKIVQRVPVRIEIDDSEGDNLRALRAGLSTTVEVDTRGTK